ncbi:MAG: hypothetical protein SXQ77_03085 [Halobacteria archaeon]|nr:hypothetical protein [Halobacteria archaeon]
MVVHQHMIDEHADVIEVGDDNIYTYKCPVCGEEAQVRPGTGAETPEMLEKFTHDIKLTIFDKLLNHLEEEHEY